ncbi:MAG: alpha-galactosidase [Propionibacteriaceae bacterium]
MVSIEWNTSHVALRFLADGGPVRLVDIAARGDFPYPFDAAIYARAHQPLIEIVTPTFGNDTSSNSNRHSGTHIGASLRYLNHVTSATDGVECLVIEQADPVTGLTTLSRFEALTGVAAVRTTTTVSVAAGHAPQTLWAVTSLATGAGISDTMNDLDVWRADCTWAAENRWRAQPLRSPGLVATQPSARGETIRSCFSASSTSTWSSGAFVPAGAVQNRRTGTTLAWQLEHNGAWLWEVGERPGQSSPLTDQPIGTEEAAGPPTHDNRADGAYVAALGPTDTLHHWSVSVDAATTFTSVPVTFTAAGSFEQAFGQLAAHRRSARRDHPQNVSLPVVFNDYMDTLEGDPTEAKLLPLIDAAALVGCEYFCIDAGWYDDTAGWWSSVGDWVPSTVRFPRGLRFILDRIRRRGMIPGLWLEPEVVGVTSRAATTLPDSAFLQRAGVRVRERDRYLLDLRSTDARAHLDSSVDRLVEDLGVGYFKLDYNVTPGPGTDWNAPSVGHGLLEHNRAVLTWLDSVLDRHRDLILENCGSGALRSDFAMLSRLQLQSTSDQQDPLLYPMIAVGALVHILPEQAANWAYPQSTMSDELIAFTMCTGMAGRLYQAGLIDRMSPRQLALVAAGVATHKATRETLATATVRFPTGVPSWDDNWITVAFETEEDTLVIAWRHQQAPVEVALELPHLGSADVCVTQLYPPVATLPEWSTIRTPTGLTVKVDDGVAAARMWRVART